MTDAYPKPVVGYCLHPLPTVEGARNALAMALQSAQPRPVFLVHQSDRGSQYGSFAYFQRLRQAGIASSMTQHGAPTRTRSRHASTASWKRTFG